MKYLLISVRHKNHNGRIEHSPHSNQIDNGILPFSSTTNTNSLYILPKHIASLEELY